MKVVCVTEITKTDPGMEHAPRPQVGDIDIVINTKIKYNKSYYMLERFANEAAYLSTHFAPLSDLDETELVTEEFKEKHYEPA